MTGYKGLYVITAACFGLVVGCLMNTLEYRVRTGKSIMGRGCRCPNCSHELAMWEQLPAIGYLILKGRCRNCGQPIGIHYPLIELGMAVSYMLPALFFMPDALLTTFVCFAWSVILLSMRVIFGRKDHPKLSGYFQSIAMLAACHFMMLLGMGIVSLPLIM